MRNAEDSELALRLHEARTADDIWELEFDLAQAEAEASENAQGCIENRERLLATIASLDRAEAALREIRDTYGRVCDEFELCEHVACRSSYSAWAIADKALKELEGPRGVHM